MKFGVNESVYFGFHADTMHSSLPDGYLHAKHNFQCGYKKRKEMRFSFQMEDEPPFQFMIGKIKYQSSCKKGKLAALYKN